MTFMNNPTIHGNLRFPLAYSTVFHFKIKKNILLVLYSCILILAMAKWSEILITSCKLNFYRAVGYEKKSTLLDLESPPLDIVELRPSLNVKVAEVP